MIIGRDCESWGCGKHPSCPLAQPPFTHDIRMPSLLSLSYIRQLKIGMGIITL